MRSENLFVNDVNSLEPARSENNDDHSYTDATNANPTAANAHDHDMHGSRDAQSRDSNRPVYMPLTPDYDRLAVIEAQMSEMMNVMRTKFTQIEQGLQDTTEEVYRQKDCLLYTSPSPRDA